MKHVHRFDPTSGWCIAGCTGYREDGRLTKTGDVLRPGDPEQLTEQHDREDQTA